MMGVLMIPGCNSDKNVRETADVDRPENIEIPEQDTIPDEKSDSQKEESDSQKEKTDSQEEARSVIVYYVDDLSGVVVGKTAEIHDEFDIWNILKERGILTDPCELLNLEVNDDRTIDLNFNHATAERINSMGTTGETEIIGCIVNTYLEAYDCTGIRLLDEGENFVSSHGTEFGEYSGRIEFK